uniref:Protein BTG1 n=1 Tax=Varanus komodoensis TaxID=61221 RepID=A0A8D2LQB6_VARKO
MHPALYSRANMIREIAAAVGFISKFLRTKGLMNERQLQTFSQSLQELLAEHYKHHWFPEKPCKGSGYRCIRINHKMDPLIGQAAQRIGLSAQELFRLLPSELTLWVDPYEMSTYCCFPAGKKCAAQKSDFGISHILHSHLPDRHHLELKLDIEELHDVQAGLCLSIFLEGEAHKKEVELS